MYILQQSKWICVHRPDFGGGAWCVIRAATKRWTRRAIMLLMLKHTLVSGKWYMEYQWEVRWMCFAEQLFRLPQNTWDQRMTSYVFRFKSKGGCITWCLSVRKSCLSRVNVGFQKRTWMVYGLWQWLCGLCMRFERRHVPDKFVLLLQNRKIAIGVWRNYLQVLFLH